MIAAIIDTNWAYNLDNEVDIYEKYLVDQAYFNGIIIVSFRLCVSILKRPGQ